MHALDAVRAFAMLLGLVLHGAISFLDRVPPFWVTEDLHRSKLLSAMVFTITTFRMQLFFVLAGFFARMLVERYGLRGFVVHRGRRIVVPYVLGCLTIVPLCHLVWHHADPHYGTRASELMGGVHHFLVGPFHLWFLLYLIAFYALTAFLVGVTRWRPAHGGEGGWVERVLSSPLRVAILALPAACLMLTMRRWHVDVPGGFVPQPHLVAYYGLFYVAGWALYRRRDLLDLCRRGWRTSLVLGFVLIPLVLVLLTLGPFGGHPRFTRYQLPCTFLYSACTWFFIFGVTGGALTLLSRPRGWVRYLSDASYFLYLAHVPLEAFLQVQVRAWPYPAVVKFVGVTAVSFGLLLAIYHVAVRPTPLGTLLNGPYRGGPHRGAPKIAEGS